MVSTVRNRTSALKIFGSRLDSGQMLYLRLSDIVTLAINTNAAAMDPEIGFEDADRTLEDFWRQLNATPVAIRKTLVESALWSCTMLDEKDALWLPRGNKNYRGFLDEMLPSNCIFDRKLNLIIEKENTR